jgi:hypothetical protein
VNLAEEKEALTKEKLPESQVLKRERTGLEKRAVSTSTQFAKKKPTHH